MGMDFRRCRYNGREQSEIRSAPWPFTINFAAIYQRGPYIRFSQGLAESILPEYLEELGCKPRKMLDVACGEGSLAVAMAKMGIKVTGMTNRPR